MIKYIFLVIASLWMAACAAHNERYYSLHPKVLEAAIIACPEKSPTGISCEQLKIIASHVNELAYQLRLNPQGYGKEILMLQETIAKQELNLRQSPNEPKQQASLIENQHQLGERLAVVKWLESPGGP